MRLNCLSRWVALLALVIACASCSEGASSEVNTGALSGSSASMCTYVPEDWVARCAAGLGQTSRCREMSRAASADEREVAALALNLWSSASGRTRRGLGDLHFGFGTRLEWSLDQVLELTSHHADAQVLAAVRDANRSFAGCFDARVAVAWVETPVCGASPHGSRDRVSGPETARCVALDGDCRRGHYDATRGCCGETEMPAGAMCGEEDVDDRDEHGCHAGHHHGDRDSRSADGHDDHGHDGHTEARLCSPVGQCVHASEVPMSTRGLGEALWVEPVRIDGEWEAPVVWHLDPDASDGGPIEIRVGDQPVAIVPASAENHRVRVSASPEGTLGIVAVDLVHDDPSVSRSLYVPRRISLNVDLDGGETFEVCAAIGRFDDLPTLLPDCTGGQVVTCPSAEGDAIACTLHPEGYALVSAPGLSVAWERGVSTEAMAVAGAIPPPNDNPGDGGVDGGRDAGHDSGLGVIRPLQIFIVLGVGRLGPIVVGGVRPGGGATIRPCASASCTTSCGSTGVRVCVNGALGACITTSPERCNGRDDDCDGRVDEYGGALCNDGITCTGDRCEMGVCVNDRGGDGSGGVPSHVGPGAFRVGSCHRRLPPATCQPDLCAPIAFVLPPTDTITGADANGCQYIAGNNFCTNTWDSCACNGSEACDPTTAGADQVTGCIEQPRFSTSVVFPGRPPFIHDPCDRDRNACTDEFICCEGDLRCRLLEMGDPTALFEFATCDRIPQVTGVPGLATRFTGTADGQTAGCIAFVLPGTDASDPSGVARARVCPLDGWPCTVPPPGGLCTVGTCNPELALPAGTSAPDVEVISAAGVIDLPFPIDFDIPLPAVLSPTPPCVAIPGDGGCVQQGCNGVGACLNCIDGNACTSDCLVPGAPATAATCSSTGRPEGATHVAEVGFPPNTGCTGLTNLGCGVNQCDGTAAGFCEVARSYAGANDLPTGQCRDLGQFSTCFHTHCQGVACLPDYSSAAECEALVTDPSCAATCEPVNVATQIPGAPLGCSVPAGTCLIDGRCVLNGAPFSEDDQCRFCGAGGTVAVSWSFRSAGLPYVDSHGARRCCDGIGNVTSCVF